MCGGWHIALLEPYAFPLRLDEHDLWENRVARVLRTRGYEAYYPGIPRQTHKNHRVPRMGMEPMFPGYMLVKEGTDGWGWEALRTTPGIRHQSLLINPASGKLAVLPDEEFWRIAEIELRRIDQMLNPPKRQFPYKVGDRIKVTGGAFAGYYAKIEELDGDERVALLMNIFGRESRVYASHEQLAPAV